MASLTDAQDEKVELPVETAVESTEGTQTNQTDEPISERPAASHIPYSTFTLTERKVIVLTASIASFFSPLSSNIYLPALNTIAQDLHVSNSKINLTVTTYLIFQGLAPTMVAGFSDNAGRRPAYMLCFVIYIAANIGLALQNNYAALLVLRCVQSAGSSSTVALASGVVADIATSADRGVYIGFSSIGSMLGPTVAPVIGGLLSQYLGWKWIFWFLTIFAAAFFLPLMLFFPETCRKVVGDGSVPPPALNHSLKSLLEEKRRKKAGTIFQSEQQDELRKNYRLGFPNPLSTLVLVTDKLAGTILFSNGLVLACTYAVLTGIPSQFKAIYGFNDLQISLVFIPIGVGSIMSALTTGKIIDWNYRRHAKRLGRSVVRNRQDDLSDFPIERARLEVAIPFLYLGACGMIIYGWVIYFETNLAGPLILLFIIGYGIIAAFQVLQILMIDIYPGKPATAMAANNLVRCLLGAAATAVVGPMLNKMGRGWTYTFAALLWVAFSPMLLVLIKRGPRWRREKKMNTEKAEEEVERKKEAKISNGENLDAAEERKEAE